VHLLSLMYCISIFLEQHSPMRVWQLALKILMLCISVLCSRYWTSCLIMVTPERRAQNSLVLKMTQRSSVCPCSSKVSSALNKLCKRRVATISCAHVLPCVMADASDADHSWRKRDLLQLGRSLVVDEGLRISPAPCCSKSVLW
jgi:hypothetical protein